MTATTVLRSEHNHILAMIACLRAASEAYEYKGQFDSDTFRTGLDFIRLYADAWHHAKEEDLLFPALEDEGMPREGGPIAVMLREHVMGRSYAQKIAVHLEAAADGDEEARFTVVRYTLAYAELLTQHIQKENGVLFNMADQLLPPDVQARLEREYQAAIPDGTGAETGRQFEEAVAALCKRWNVDPAEAANAGAGFRCG